MQQSATKPSVESAASDSDVAAANAGGDNSARPNICNNHTKKPSVSEKLCSLPDAGGRVTMSFLDSEMSISFTENKFAKNEASGTRAHVLTCSCVTLVLFKLTQGNGKLHPPPLIYFFDVQILHRKEIASHVKNNRVFLSFLGSLLCL